MNEIIIIISGFCFILFLILYYLLRLNSHIRCRNCNSNKVESKHIIKIKEDSYNNIQYYRVYKCLKCNRDFLVNTDF